MKTEWLYLLINFGVILVPLLFSFDRKVRFYRLWRAVLPAILIVGLPFLVWDVWFTSQGIWGFDQRYITEKHLFGLPPGEWLFFLTVPYACTFIHFSLKAYIGDWLSARPWKYMLWVIIFGALALIAISGPKTYTLSACVPAVVIAAVLLTVRPRYLQQLSFSFMICILPFLLVNGILTGSWIEGQIVWYNEKAFSGIRCFTIPLEDFFYAFDLLALNIILAERFLTAKPSAHTDKPHNAYRTL